MMDRVAQQRAERYAARRRVKIKRADRLALTKAYELIIQAAEMMEADLRHADKIKSADNLKLAVELVKTDRSEM